MVFLLCDAGDFLGKLIPALRTVAKIWPFEIVERKKVAIKEQKIKMEKEEAEQKKTLEIAKKLKASGMDDKKIKEMTNLPISEIREL